MDLSNEVLQPNFNIKKYLGTWYEIAKTPNFFEKGCSSAKAEYQLMNANTISVKNTCLGPDGKPLRRTCEEAGNRGCRGVGNTVPPVIRGTARPVNPEEPAALRVNFPGTPDVLPPDVSNYLVHLTDYRRFAVVGDHSKVFLFILARAPRMDERLYDDLISFSKKLGYNTNSIIINERDGYPVVVEC